MVSRAADRLAALCFAQDKPADKAADKDKPARRRRRRRSRPSRSSRSRSTASSIGGVAVAVHGDGGHADRPQRQGRAVGEHGLRRLRPKGRRRRRAAADHLRVQRRPRLLVGLAAHGRARAAPRGHRRRRAHAAAALPGRRQRVQHPGQDRPRDDRSGRHGTVEGRRRGQGQGLLGRRTPTSTRSRGSSASTSRDNGRWNSPKYMLGESYGTTRAAGIVDCLAEQGAWPSTA